MEIALAYLTPLLPKFPNDLMAVQVLPIIVTMEVKMPGISVIPEL
jgi:hypothetical protein